jgi:hypothetical protein
MYGIEAGAGEERKVFPRGSCKGSRGGAEGVFVMAVLTISPKPVKETQNQHTGAYLE